LVNFKLSQFPAQASTRTMSVPVRWIGLDSCTDGGNGFLNAWLADGNDSDQPQRSVNWGAIAGLAISLVMSGGFWAGVGFLVARALK
jgi:hypothetical protein